MSEALRSRRSDVRYEPTFEQAPASAVGTGDPLAELARIVGHEDPFRSMIRHPAQQPGWRLPPGAPSNGDAFEGEPIEDGHDGFSREEPSFFGDQAGVEGAGARLRPSLHESPAEAPRYADDHGYAQDHGDAEHDDAQSPEGYDPNAYDPTAYEHEAAGSDDGYHDGHASDFDHPTAVLSADAWANAGEVAPETRDHLSPSNEGAERRAAPRRPLVVLAAVLVLTGGGLAATFLARTGHGGGATKDAPTILAASGPNKIKLADPVGTPEDADAALLSRNGAAASGGPAKVVNSQEQPIDLAQLPKATPKPSSGAIPAVSDGGPFPEPRKVKTFIVHPDATGFGDTTRSAAPREGAADASGAIGAAFPTPAIPAGPAANPGPLPRAATPRTARAATTPKITAEPSITDLAEAALTSPKTRQPAAPGPSARVAKPKPIEVAEADPNATSATTGAFGLQLAAAPNEQDARDAFVRLQHKFAGELGSFKPSIRKVETGDKTVFRLRVGSLSQDEAKTLCAKLQAGGGTCYVVHN